MHGLGTLSALPFPEAVGQFFLIPCICGNLGIFLKIIYGRKAFDTLFELCRTHFLGMFIGTFEVGMTQ